VNPLAGLAFDLEGIDSHQRSPRSPGWTARSWRPRQSSYTGWRYAVMSIS
jgi:hypothetical protein